METQETETVSNPKIASVVCCVLGIISLFMAISNVNVFTPKGNLNACAFCAVQAIILGHVARVLARKSTRANGNKILTRGGKYSALLGLILGYAFIGFTFYYYTVMAPGLVKAVEKADAAAEIKVKAGFTPRPDFDGHPIDLKAYYNASLTDPMIGNALIHPDTLEEVPSGSHAFAGIPFRVDGVVILAGRNAIKSGKKYPVKVDNIQIKQKCQRLDLLDGITTMLDRPSKKVAKITLEYSDGSSREVDLVNGENLLSAYGPAGDKPQDPGAELAWAGFSPKVRSNQKRYPEARLRLYKTSIINPQPDVEITSLAYESYLTDASPFLLGLTVE